MITCWISLTPTDAVYLTPSQAVALPIVATPMSQLTSLTATDIANIVAALSSVSSGTGPYAVTVTVEANSVPLVGFRVYASQSGQPDATAVTNSSGVATFNLYAGSATFTPDNSTGYSGSPVTETISGAGAVGSGLMMTSIGTQVVSIY